MTQQFIDVNGDGEPTVLVLLYDLSHSLLSGVHILDSVAHSYMYMYINHLLHFSLVSSSRIHMYMYNSYLLH